MSDLHDAMSLVEERLERRRLEQTRSKPVEVGEYQEPKPSRGEYTEAISAAALFPKARTPLLLGGKRWTISADKIPPKLDDSNMRSLVTTDNRIGGQIIRTHAFHRKVSFTKSFFARVGFTEFINETTKESVITPGVNLNVSAPNGEPGQTSISVGAQQGSISKIIGERSGDPTPANKFRIEAAFVPPKSSLPGLLALNVRRTQFPHLLVRYQLWDTNTEPLADIAISMPPTYLNPLALILPTVTTTFLYEIAPGKPAKPIEFEDARKLYRKHKEGELITDPLADSLSRIQKRIDFSNTVDELVRSGGLS